MVLRSTALMVGLALVVVPVAGCLGLDPGDQLGEGVTGPDAVDLGPRIDLNGTMVFAEPSEITPAIFFGHGLYEPTIDVSDSGVIYISAHTTGVDTTGAPAFFSDDDGETWEQLPFAGPAQLPAPAHGGTPPPSDEIFIVAGADGQAWGVDITLATFPVNGWCDDGAEHCYHNPDAYDEAQAQTTRVAAATGQDDSCSLANLNDRPWAAYANGTLLMVNNPGGGPVQVGVLEVPPATYVGGPGVGGPAPLDAEWNLCAGEGGGSIPGIPDLRDDGVFAVPQIQGGELVLVVGNVADVSDVHQHTVFSNSHEAVSAVGVGDQVVFDAEGTMYVIAMTNEAAEPGPGAGGIHLAVSTDDGHNFTERTLRFDRPVSSVYLDGNDHGPGAIINWGLTDEFDGPTDWYLGHLRAGPNGEPLVEEATLAVEQGPPASRHVQGAAVGPDGRAYMVMSEISGNDNQGELSEIGSAPMSVVVQLEGPTLPVPLLDAVDA